MATSYAPIVNAPRGSLQGATGSGKMDLGGNILAAAQAGLLNKWAKYKPVVYSGWNTVTQLDRSSSDPAAWRWKDDSVWWKGDDGKCGLNIQSFTDFGSMTNSVTFLYKLLHGQLGWTYVYPTNRFRAFDLIQYKSDAVKPVADTLASTDIWMSTQGVIEFAYDLNSVGSDNLTLAAIAINSIPLSQHYLGVVLYRSTRWLALTSTALLGTGAATIRIEAGQNLVGQWSVIPFLSSTQMTIDSTIGEGQYASFDVTVPQTVTIRTPGTIIEMYVNAYWNDSLGTQVSWELVVQSNQTMDRTVSNIVVYLYSTDADVPDQDPQSGQREGASAAMTVTVPANGRVTRTGVITPQFPKTSAKTYWVYAQSDGDFAVIYNQVEDYGDVAF